MQICKQNIDPAGVITIGPIVQIMNANEFIQFMFRVHACTPNILPLYSTGLTFQRVSINLKHIFVLKEEENEEVLL